MIRDGLKIETLTLGEFNDVVYSYIAEDMDDAAMRELDRGLAAAFSGEPLPSQPPPNFTVEPDPETWGRSQRALAGQASLMALAGPPPKPKEVADG